MQIELTDEEREILEGAHTTLEVEWHRTDDLHSRDYLKRRVQMLDLLLTKLGRPAMSES